MPRDFTEIASIVMTNESIRERLRREATEKERAQSSQKERAAADEAWYREYAHAKLAAAATFCSEIVRDLNTIDSALEAQLELPDAKATKIPFVQKGYHLHIDNPDAPRRVAVAGICELTGELSYLTESVVDGDRFERFITDAGIEFHRRRQHDAIISGEESSRFVLESSFRAGFELRADLSQRQITVITRCIETEPKKIRSLKPERVDDILFEQLTELLLRETNSLTKVKVDPEIRAQLQAESERRKREIAQAIAAGEAEQEEARPVNQLKKQARNFLQRIRKTDT
jgi:hypothetical protein